MNESPWQPPTDGEHDRADLPAPEPVADEPRHDVSDVSPWSPEGASAWNGGTPHLPPPASATPPPPPATTAPLAAPTPVGDEPVPAAEAPAEPRRGKLVVAGAVVAVAALGLAGLFAVQRFSDESAGGAATADELGLELLGAIEAEDVLGVIDTMLPGERDSLGEPFVEMVGELERLEVLSAETDLSHLLGLDVELVGEVVDVRATNVPDIVNVSLTADATVTIDGATLPVGAFVEDQLPDEALAELRGTRVTETDQLAVELTAVQHGDRWFFSLFHTLAELARADAGGEPIPDEGVAAVGAETPEGAVNQLLDRLEQLDLRGIIATLDPAEAAALQRYAPLFLDDAEAALAEVPIDWRVDVREFRVDGDGAERTLFVDALGVSGEVEGAPFSVSYSDECVRAEFEGETIEQCGAAMDEELGSMFDEAPAIEAFAASLEEAFADLEPIGFELRERDGAWYVSPLATGTEAILAVMRALDRNELDRLVEDGTAAAEELFDVFLGGYGFDDDFVIDEELVLPDDPLADDVTDDGILDEDVTDDGTLDEDVTDEGTLDDGSTEEDPAEAAWDECSGEPLAVDAAACFDRYVQSGEIDRLVVPTALLHPECGLAELTWEGGLYSASDEEFAAALDVAVPCFQALVASGELEEWLLPFEVSYAECFEDRNWYAEFEDEAYNARVDACIAAG